MYTSYIGRRALDLYNEHMRDGPPLSPKSFFDEVLFPVAFDHERYFIWPGNAPFGQNKYYLRREESSAREDALEEMHDKIEESEGTPGHLYMGGPARDILKTTTGQISSVGPPSDPSEAYYSWIGELCGVGIGKLSMLIDNDVVLLALLEGWSLYRKYLNQTPSLKGKQIATWNGQWITHRFGPDYNSDDPLRDFNPPGTSEISTKNWSKVVFSLARELPESELRVYVYALGKRNETIGFRQLLLPEVQYLTDLYEKLFGTVEGVSARRLADVFEPAFSLYRACEQGAIGLKALQPNRLRKYIPGRSDSKMPGTTRSENKFTRYLIFQTWIIAMLNNEDLIDTTEQLAEALREYAQSDERAKTTAKRTAEQVLEASHRREFLESLSEVVKNDATHAPLIDEIGDEVVKMPSSDFPLFATLLRLKYHVFSQQQSV